MALCAPAHRLSRHYAALFGREHCRANAVPLLGIGGLQHLVLRGDNEMVKLLQGMALTLALGGVSHVGAAVLTARSPACGASTATTSNAGYLKCLGSFSGNMDNQRGKIWDTMTAAGERWTSVGQAYVSSESFTAALNPFSQNEGLNDDGVINFDAPQTGLFALGLKQGRGFSLYLFDGALVEGGIDSVAYDTNGVKAAKTQSFDLSHAGFFGAVSPVPEPSAYAMMLAGLLVVGASMKLRKDRKN